MHRYLLAPLLATAVSSAAIPAAAEVPASAALIDRAIAASEIDSTLADHDMLRASIHQEETTMGGTSKVSDMTAVYYGERLDSIRLELAQGVSLVLDGDTSWAMRRGQLDTRVLAPRMAAGTIHQILFPLLLPFSLRMPGVNPGAVREGTFDDQSVWVMEVKFDKDFFVVPSMDTTWRVFFSRDDGSVLGAEYFPPNQVRSVRSEGIRYRVLTRSDVDGLKLPNNILLDGIDTNGIENGHVRVTKIDTVTIGPYDRSIFIHPDELDRIESGDVD